MATTRISGLPAITSVDAANDPLPIVDVSDTSQSVTGTTKKITVDQIESAIFGATGSKAIVVDNVAALKALTVASVDDGQFFLTRGYYTDNDGGQGTYIYDAASSTADNGGTVIAPTSGVGRYLLQISFEANVKQFGAKGDGVADDTVAIQSAINSCEGKKITFPNGNYLVTDSLSITVNSYSLVGEKTERRSFTAGSTGSVITFSPVDKTKFLIKKYLNAVSSTTIGPFEHRDIRFDLGVASQANGFQFGNDDPSYLPISDSPTPGVQFQAYVCGILFDGCHFIGQTPQLYSTANGNISLSQRRAIGLCKSFEAVINNCSFATTGHCVYSIGSDKPTVSNTRASGQIPIEFIASGTFAVQHTVDNFQSEGWLFSPIITDGVSCCVSNSRFECNASAFGSTTGTGIFSVPTCTASVTKDSASVVFSRSMTNVLFPNKSIVRLSSGSNSDDVILSSLSVDGLTGTVDTSAFRFTWTAASASVVRIHSFGPIHKSVYECSLSNSSITTYGQAPALAYRLGRGSVNVSNCFVGIGSPQTGPAIVIGNKPAGAASMNGQLAISNSDVNFLQNPISPFAVSTNWSSSPGGLNSFGERMLGGDLFESISRANRVWSYSPGRGQSSNNASENITSKLIAGDSGTQQNVWAWFIDNAPTVGRNLWFYDDSLPSANSGQLKFTIRYKALSAGTTISTVVTSSGGGATINTETSSDSNWKTYSFVYLGTPSQWSSGNNSRALQISCSADVYIASIVIEDLPEKFGFGCVPIFGLDSRGGIQNRGITSNSDFSSIPRKVLFSKSSGDSATGSLSLVATVNFTAGFSWRNATIRTVASHVNAYASNQGSVIESVQFRALNSASPAAFNVISTASNGVSITLAYAAVSSSQMTVTASYNDVSVPGSVPTHELWMSMEIDAPFQINSIS